MSETPPAEIPDGARDSTTAAESGAAKSPHQERQAARPPKTRTGAAYTSLVAGVVVLVLLLVFILENTESVKISYFGAGGHLPLGIALLLAAVGGALLVGIVGTARIFQVRRHATRVGRRARRRSR